MICTPKVRPFWRCISLLSNVRDNYFTKVSYVNLAPRRKLEIKPSEMLMLENSLYALT